MQKKKDLTVERLWYGGTKQNSLSHSPGKCNKQYVEKDDFLDAYFTVLRRQPLLTMTNKSLAMNSQTLWKEKYHLVHLN